jgi:hypothetical protein
MVNYDAFETAKIIVREDYRVYWYQVDPVSHTHRNMIAKVQPKVDSFFEDRQGIQATRKIQRTATGKRMMWIQFGTIADSHMFYLCLAEHIDTKGMNFERFTSQ